MESLGRALSLLLKYDDWEISDMIIQGKEIYYLNHRYKDEVIVPLVAVSPNVYFLLDKGVRYVLCTDEIKCRVVDCKEMHICELVDDIKRLYNMDAWSFINRWYQYEKAMDSMEFLKLKLVKV